MASKRQNKPERGEVWDVDFNPIIKSTVEDVRSELLSIENQIPASPKVEGPVTERIERLVQRLKQTIDELSAIGAEISKIRPAAVIGIATSGRLPLHIVVPITTGKKHFQNYFWMVLLRVSQANGLSHDCFADTAQIKSISRDRFIRRRGELTETQIQDIAIAATQYIGLNKQALLGNR